MSDSKYMAVATATAYMYMYMYSTWPACLPISQIWEVYHALISGIYTV